MAAFVSPLFIGRADFHVTNPKALLSSVTVRFSSKALLPKPSRLRPSVRDPEASFFGSPSRIWQSSSSKKPQRIAYTLVTCQTISERTQEPAVDRLSQARVAPSTGANGTPSSRRGPPTILIAMGGNSLLDPRLPPTIENQFAVTAKAVVPIAELIARGEHVVITHGNGPQVGFMQLRVELAKNQVHEVPLDSLVADTQGAIGYMIQRDLREELERRGCHANVVTIVTEVEVDPHDRAFSEPTKPIGQFYSAEEAEKLQKERGWDMVEDSHRGWRRVVASPAPINIVQIDTIKTLLDAGVTVIACGGGGIPVMRSDDGHLKGLEAVIDKDRASSLLAEELGVKRMIVTTAVDAVYADYLTDNRRRLSEATPEQLAAMAAAGQFPPGSMGPKVEAALHFLARGGKEVFVCTPEALLDAVDGHAGTVILSHSH